MFNARYAPTLATQHAVASYLTASGLTVEPSGSPFLIRAEGSSSMVSFAFRTTLSTYRDPHGTSYFANSTPVWLPTSIAGSSLGVIGLTNTVVEHQMLAKPTAGRFNQTRTPLETKSSMIEPGRRRTAASEETSYLVAQQLLRRLLAPVRLRRRTRLQRPDAVADQLHLRRAERWPARRGQGRQPGRVRAVRLPGVTRWTS